MDNKKFIDWYENHLRVAGYPKLSKIELEHGYYSPFDVFINVSDEFYHDHEFLLRSMGKISYWLPMGETEKDMGMSSIFGALQVLYWAYNSKRKVYLHCHAGANRSPTVAACFYYMMTGEHIEESIVNGITRRTSRLLANAGVHLPELQFMENWLKNCKHAFDNPHKFIGGMYDWTIRKANMIMKIYNERKSIHP